MTQRLAPSAFRNAATSSATIATITYARAPCPDRGLPCPPLPSARQHWCCPRRGGGGAPAAGATQPQLLARWRGHTGRALPAVALKRAQHIPARLEARVDQRQLLAERATRAFPDGFAPHTGQRVRARSGRLGAGLEANYRHTTASSARTALDAAGVDVGLRRAPAGAPARTHVPRREPARSALPRSPAEG